MREIVEAPVLPPPELLTSDEFAAFLDALETGSCVAASEASDRSLTCAALNRSRAR